MPTIGVVQLINCWMRFVYAGVVSGVDIDRNDGAYPSPHWAGKFVLLGRRR